MRSLASNDFFRKLYAHLGGLITAGALRSLAWLPLLAWLGRGTPEGSTAGSYVLGALGFLLLALSADPFLAGGVMGLAERVAAGRPTSPRDALAGLGRRYRALLAWTWIQALVALSGSFNLLQLLAPESPVPGFLGLFSTALSLWVWLALRAMNIHLPRLLLAGHLPLRGALLEALLTAMRRPGRSLGQLTFRFGLGLLLAMSGVGLILGLGSFAVLHGFLLGDRPQDAVDK